MEKKVARMLKKFRNVRGLTEAEKYLFAHSLAGTPDERWRMHETFLRSHGLYARASRKKVLERTYKRKEFVGRPKYVAYLPLLMHTMKFERSAALK